MPPVNDNEPRAHYYELWIWGNTNYATRSDYLEHEGTYTTKEEALRVANDRYARYCSKVAIYEVSKVAVDTSVNKTRVEPCSIFMSCYGDNFTGETEQDREKIRILMGKTVLTEKEVNQMVPLAKAREWKVKSPYVVG